MASRLNQGTGQPITMTPSRGHTATPADLAHADGESNS